MYRRSNQSMASRLFHDRVSKQDDGLRVADSIMEGYVFKETEAEEKESSKGGGHGSPEQLYKSRFK